MTDAQRIKSISQQLSGLLQRVNTVTANATGSEWPYSSLPESTRLFAANLAETAFRLVCVAAEQVGLQPRPKDGAVSEVAVARKHDDLFALIAQQTGASKTALGESRFAASSAYAKTAAELIQRAERCLENEETIDGREIKHGPLHDK